MDVFGQKWIYSGKRGCSRAKVIVFLQSGCIRQSSCTRVKVVVIEQKWLYSGKIVVFE